MTLRRYPTQSTHGHTNARREAIGGVRDFSAACNRSPTAPLASSVALQGFGPEPLTFEASCAARTQVHFRERSLRLFHIRAQSATISSSLSGEVAMLEAKYSEFGRSMPA